MQPSVTKLDILFNYKMLILSLLINVLIAQQVIKSPNSVAAPFIESGTISATSTRATTITFQSAQPDTLFKFLIYV